MFILEYNSTTAAVVIDGRNIYRFKSTIEAKEKIDAADQFFVQYKGGGQIIENTPQTKSRLKVKYDGFAYDEL